MRNLHLLDAYRDVGGDVVRLFGSVGDHETGTFLVPSPIDKANIRVIATVGEGWDHVSASRATRCPNWPEMEYIKRLFFRDDETAMQLHVPPADHVNCHPYCLHLWRPLGTDIPRPPAILVVPVGDAA